MKRLSILAAALTLCAFAQTATAGLLNDEVKAVYYFPSLESEYATIGQGVVDADGLQMTFFDVGVPIFDMNITDRRITIDYQYAATWSGAAFNGFTLTDLTKSLPQVSIGAGSNMGGFGAGNVSVSGNTLFVNWQGLSFDSDTLVVLDLAATPGEVPEPVSLGLLGLGLAGLAASRRLRK